MNRLTFIAAIGSIVCAYASVSCASSDDSPTDFPAQPSSRAPGSASASGSGGMQQNDDPAVLAHIQELEKKQADAAAAFDKDPKSGPAKKNFIDATNNLAYEVMAAVGTLGPRNAYPRALKLYRSVLEVDPKNKEAAEWVTKIEDIYKSLGRPVPEG